MMRFKKRIIPPVFVSILVIAFIFALLPLINKPKQIQLDQVVNLRVGNDMTQLDYVSDNYIVFHDYFGLFVYDNRNNTIISAIDLKYYSMHYASGDQSSDIFVEDDDIFMHNYASDKTLKYSISKNTITQANVNIEDLYKHYDSLNPIGEYAEYIENYLAREGNYSHYLYKSGDTISYLYSATGYVRDLELSVISIKSKEKDKISLFS